MPVSPLRRTDPTEIGGYAIAARLGEGGMGVVYLANGPAGRPLAIKLISPRVTGEPDFRLRFRREVNAARAVGGACAVRVVAADPDAPRPWLATEYVAGSSLAEVVDAEGPLPGPVLDTLAACLAEALLAIHQAGVVHRDLKPSNVILSATGPKVIDFGVSRLVEATPLTGPGSILGSPGYMAPEQVSADQIGPAADVFSWALTVAFAATGRPPYGLGRPEVLIYRVIGERPDIRGVPERFAPILEAALRPDPASRPTAAALLRWLLPDAADPADATARLLDEQWRLTGHAAQAAVPLPITRLVPPHQAARSGPGSAPAGFGPPGPYPPSGPARSPSGPATPPFGPEASPDGPSRPPTPGAVPAARRAGRRAWLSSQWIPITIAIVGVLTVTIVAMVVTSGGSTSATPPTPPTAAPTSAPTVPTPSTGPSSDPT
ncbi:serine/threonine-protein kinase, partial [Frankia canadensis]|uniref:serine/threonine-protein kinase n=1 Tax=Frankia canadensis TaxID=1836972 RepID=UPI000C79BD43